MDEAMHVSVLLSECIEYLNINPSGIYLDGTLGMGGHSYEIVKRLNDEGRLICIDKDTFAIEKAKERLKDHLNKIKFIHDDFSNTAKIISELGYNGVDGMLFDLGVSSPQLDNSERGFSYMVDAPLDMRMNSECSLTAYDVVNHYSKEELIRIFYSYGEERFSRIIAENISNYREQKTIESTLELVNIIKKSLPSSALREKQHPAKRVFQAIRIEVNNELGSLEQMMDTAPNMLNQNGRMCIISFHSLEDRIVKTKIREKENGCICPKESPICVCGFKQSLKSVTRKPIIPSDLEINSNPRARSAKLRVVEKL